jgi:acyl-CoA synthetase (NDP forming)
MKPSVTLQRLFTPRAVAVIGASRDPDKVGYRVLEHIVKGGFENILRFSQLVTDFPEIAEIDINPLLVRSKGEGTVALDARIRLGRINK